MITKEMNKGIIFLMWLLVSSCTTSPQEERLLVYFDLKGLIDAELEAFGHSKPKVRKSVTLDGEVEQIEVSFDSGEWRRELDIFFENDINKPSLVGSFDDLKDGDKIRFLRKDQEEDGVKEMKITYFEATEFPREVEVIASSRNPLYNSDNHLKLIFTKEGKSFRLDAYEIAGKQSIIFGDVTEYQLVAALEY